MWENRITAAADEPREPEHGVQHIGQVLMELLAQYEARYPGLHVTIVAEPSVAA